VTESKETRIRHHCKTLRLPSIVAALSETLTLAQQENWSLEDSLLYLLEAEIEGRQERRIARLMRQAHLPPGKTLDAFDQSRLTRRLRQMIPRLRDGDFINRAENVLVFGLPGTGKTHFTAALAGEWIQNNHSVLFTPAYILIDGLLRAKRDHELARELRRLDRFEVVIPSATLRTGLDDIGYIQQSREEMEVLFTFFAERYERRSIVITSNLVFSAWDKIFKDPLTTAAAIDRVVHHSHIVEFGPEITSMRAEEAQRRQRSAQ